MSAPQSRFSLLLLTLAVACGGSNGDAKPQETNQTAAPAATVEPTGNVIVVKMVTNGADNYFEPNLVEASPGDVVRFTLEMGVHNVYFVPDSNPGVAGLPEASDMLQIPGQTWDFVVPDVPGKRLFFECIPHAALGMVGHVVVK